MSDHYQNNTAKLHRQSPPSLPAELIFKILLRCPVKLLLQLKCVCKSWKTLISHPQFTYSHIRRLTGNPSITHQRLFSSSERNDHHFKIKSFPMKRWLEDPSEHNELVEFNTKHKFRILGSCNGLLCLFDKDHGYVKLWNPSIGFESRNSPTPDCFDKCKYIMFIRYYGFGYDHVNDKYKVLVIVRRLSGRPLENVTQIYTFGENCWTTIQNIPFDSNTPLGKFVSGTLNWLVVIKGVDSTSRQSVILSFDLEKETYKELLLPENDGVKAYNHMLGVFNNCLCVVYFDSNETVLDFWLMKSYGVAESWTRLMTILPQRLFPVCRILYSPTDLTFIIGNGIVLTTTSNISLLHNYFNNGRLNLQLIRSEHGWDQHIYHESLVAPQC